MDLRERPRRAPRAGDRTPRVDRGFVSLRLDARAARAPEAPRARPADGGCDLGARASQRGRPPRRPPPQRLPAGRPEEEVGPDLLQSHDLLVQPVYFYEYPFEPFVAVSLLPPPDAF